MKLLRKSLFSDNGGGGGVGTVYRDIYGFLIFENSKKKFPKINYK